MNAETNTMQTITEDKNSYLSQGNFEHFYRMANMICKSSMVPKAFQDKPQDVLVAMEMGRSLGLSPLSAVQNIAVINGKPSLYGDAILAVCSGHPDFENINEQKLIDQSGKLLGYKCSVKRKNRDEVTKTFTVADAELAGLWGKMGPWKQYPERMLQMRARAFALRDSFADALGGVRFVEEVLDYEIRDITPRAQKSQAVKDDLKALIDKNKAPVIEAIVEVQPTVTTISIDELTAIRDLLKDNKIDNTKRDTILKTFNITHIEQLASEQVDEFISQLLG